jgi:TetR/AcrR family transcriptional regulator, transcriptional repressor of aconitase
MHPKLSDATRQERRDQILDGARACVDEHGLEAVSMEMIIARSGVSTGTVYRYFSGKDEVISAAVLDGTTRLGEALAPILS